jgi:hypothetical protein
MNNTSEMNSNDHNKGTGSDNHSVHENENNQEVIFEVSIESNRDPEITPLPFVKGLPVESFDMYLLPKSLVPWAKDVQYRLQCPADYIGVSIMIGLATSVGNKVTVQPKAQDHSWLVVPNLWGLLIGDPSSMKSPAMDVGLSHISQMEKAIIANSDPLENLRLMVKDSTIEKVQVLQSCNPAGLLYVKDEISSLFHKFDQPNSTDRQYLLEAFNGNSSYTVDRMSRETIFIEKNTLSLIGTIQPDLLKSFFLKSGSSNDGFIQRLQLAVWPDPVQMEYIDAPPDDAAVQQAWAIFTDLYQIPKKRLKFDPQAQTVFMDWYKQTIFKNQELSQQGLNELVSHLTKYRSLVPSIALLLQLAEDKDSTCIEAENLNKAIMWANYLISHAKRIYSIGDIPTSIAELLLEKRGQLNFNFTAGQIVQKGWKGLTNTEEIKKGIEVLINHCYLFQVENPNTKKGGRPSIKFRWNRNLE